MKSSWTVFLRRDVFSWPSATGSAITATSTTTESRKEERTLGTAEVISSLIILVILATGIMFVHMLRERKANANRRMETLALPQAVPITAVESRVYRPPAPRKELHAVELSFNAENIGSSTPNRFLPAEAPGSFPEPNRHPPPRLPTAVFLPHRS